MTDEELSALSEAEIKRRQWEQRAQKLERGARKRRTNFSPLDWVSFKTVKGKFVLSAVALAIAVVLGFQASSVTNPSAIGDSSMPSSSLTNPSPVVDALRPCMPSSDYQLDFDAKGISLETTDLDEVNCALEALLGGSLGKEARRFASSSDVFADWKEFPVGTGFLKINKGFDDVSFKIILEK